MCLNSWFVLPSACCLFHSLDASVCVATDRSVRGGRCSLLGCSLCLWLSRTDSLVCGQCTSQPSLLFLTAVSVQLVLCQSLSASPFHNPAARLAPLTRGTLSLPSNFLSDPSSYTGHDPLMISFLLLLTIID